MDLRRKFSIPTFTSLNLSDSPREVIYFCGNSLGPMPLTAEVNIRAEMSVWATAGVLGHHERFDGRDPWVFNDTQVADKLARLIFGCNPSEIAFTGTLTTNLNALLQAFYRPTKQRFKILCERKAFPSDMYAFQNQARLAANVHGRSLEEVLVMLDPPEGSELISTQQVLDAIKEHGNELSVVLLPGIQYYTGQYFDIPMITRATKAVGAVSGWDLAHASGNVPLRLHDWGCDFAVFCTYKYLNSGPGNMGGLFVHDDTAAQMKGEPRAAGWWGVDTSTRFEMRHNFEPAQGARGFAQSNVSMFGPACILASLAVFEMAGGVEGLAAERQRLTGALVSGLMASKYYRAVFYIMTDLTSRELPDGRIEKVARTPEMEAHMADPEAGTERSLHLLDRGLEHGAQISLKFTHLDHHLMPKVVAALTHQGIIGDERKPNVLRWAPAPLFNKESEIDSAVRILDRVLDGLV